MSKANSLCTNGDKCQYLKAGTCKYLHKGHSDTKHHHTTAKGDHKVKLVKSPKPLVAIQPMLLAAKQNVKSRTALKVEIDKAKSVYFDVKSSTDVTLPTASAAARELKLLDDELSMLKAAARGLFKGQQKFKINICSSWQLAIQATTGLVNGVLAVDPSAQAEWIAAASLFDETRVQATLVKYRVKTAVNYQSPVYPFYVIAYDPTNNAGLATIASGVEMQQHFLGIMPSTYEAVPSVGSHTDFKVVIPHGIQELDVSGQATGAWQSTQVTQEPYGFLKFRCNGDSVAATIADGGFGAFIIDMCEFRIRE